MKKAIIFLLFIAVVVGAVFGYEMYKKEERMKLMRSTLDKNIIYDGIKIDGIDVSGLSEKEALNKLEEEKSKESLSKNIKIDVDKKVYNLNFKDLKESYDFESAVKEAYNYAKEGELEKRYDEYMKLSNSPLDIKLKRTLDKSVVDDIINKIAKQNDKEVVEAKFSVKDGKVTSSQSQDGKFVNKEKLKKDILAAVDSGQGEVKAEIKTVEPKKKTSALESINGLIGEFTTDISTSSPERKTNIRVSSSTVSGVLLMPGEEFNFNSAIGRVTAAKGYKNAHVLRDGEYEDGLGGGMCQTSTTLYNALVRAGVSIKERHPHSRPASYVPKGMDGAVWAGSKNLIYKNNYDFPIYIDSKVTNSKVTFYVYGDTNKKKDHIKLESQVVEVIKSQTVEKEDKNLKPGEKRVEQKGYNGFRVVTYKIVSRNGEVISKNVFTKDYYPKRDSIVAVGPKTEDAVKDEGNISNTNNENSEEEDGSVVNLP